MPQFPCIYKNNNLLNHLVFLPEGYDEKGERKYPFILFLHGIGERGDNLELIKKHGIPKIVEQNPDFEFIAISPQCPDDSRWIYQTDKLNSLLDHAVSTYNIDNNRIYLTGLSMGGYGTWKLASEHSERFAAIAPICGHKYLDGVETLKHLPVWLFHGARDDKISIEESIEMANTLKDLGCDIKFTIYPDAKHDAWTETYSNPELYKWFLQHTKNKK